MSKTKYPVLLITSRLCQFMGVMLFVLGIVSFVALGEMSVKTDAIRGALRSGQLPVVVRMGIMIFFWIPAPILIALGELIELFIDMARDVRSIRKS